MLLASLPTPASTTRDGPGFWSPGSPTGCLRMETVGSPRFLANLRSHALLQRLRWTRLAWPLRHRRCCLPTPDTGSASTKSDSVALHTAYDLAVYASPLRLPSRRKTRFRLAATLGRTGLIPARSVRKVSKTSLSSLTHVISSPFPRLRLAHAWYLFRTNEQGGVRVSYSIFPSPGITRSGCGRGVFLNSPRVPTKQPVTTPNSR